MFLALRTLHRKACAKKRNGIVHEEQRQEKHKRARRSVNEEKQNLQSLSEIKLLNFERLKLYNIVLKSNWIERDSSKFKEEKNTCIRYFTIDCLRIEYVFNLIALRMLYLCICFI